MNRKERWKLLANFTNWLFTDMSEPLPKEVIKALNHKILVSCTFKNQLANMYLDNYLNNVYVYSIPIDELALFIKKVVKEFGLTKKDIWWFSNLEYYPKYTNLSLVKSYEKQFLSNLVNEGKIEPNFIRRGAIQVDDKNMQKQSDKSNQTVTLHNLRQEFINKKQQCDQCKECGLYSQPIVTFDSNVENLPESIDILFVAEAPGETEVEKRVPLIGRAGKLFRKFLHDYIDSKYSYFITNTCLCRPPDNRQPTEKEIKCCSNNLDEIIKITNPKVIVALGTTAANRLANISSGITKARGSIEKYTIDDKTYDVFITVHPSYIIRNPKNEYIYDEDFLKLQSYIANNESNISINLTNNESNQVTKLNSIHCINLDNKFYTDYDLVDIYYSYKIGNVYYKFRHKKTKQVQLVSFPIQDTKYAYRIQGKNFRHILLKDEVQDLIKQGRIELIYNPKPDDNYTYFESDISIGSRHSIDYFYMLQKYNIENEYQQRVCYFDIEVDSPVFPKPELAEYPITLISAKYVTDDNIHNVCYILDNESNFKNLERVEDSYLDIIDTYELKFFTDENELIKQFEEDVREYDVDILTAWNISFDLGYLINRAKKYNRTLQLSKHNIDNLEPEYDPQRNYVTVPFMTVLDLMTAYKFITPNKRESYSLDYIVQYEDIVSTGKKFKGSKFSTLWNENRIYAIAYNIEDVELIYKLDSKLSIIAFINEFRKVTAVPWQYYSSASKTSDSLILLFAKLKGMLVRNKISGQSGTGSKVGAYVYPPIPGLHKFVFEGDFKSLYPSIIQTFNISPNTYAAKFANGLKDTVDYLLKKDRKYTVIKNPIYNPQEVTFSSYDQVKGFIKDNNYIVSFAGGMFKNHDQELSILADIISYLKERRSYYKDLYKQTKEKRYDLFQLAYKIALNSLYGFLGFEGSRFMHIDLVNNVTISGQIINKLSSLTFVKLLEKDIESIQER